MSGPGGQYLYWLEQMIRNVWRSEWVQLLLSLILIPSLLFALITIAPEMVKWAGAPFLALPTALGWVQRAQPDEVILLPTDTPRTVLIIPRPGQYVLYADESFWRPGTDLQNLRRSPLYSGHQWIRILTPSGTPLPLAPVKRGVRPYDEWIVRGRPLYTFRAEPGKYQVLYTDTPPTYIAILPDYVTPQETKLQTLILIQLVILLAYPAWRRWRRWRHRREEQRQKRAEAERMWEILRRR